jgi:hypothetical protein
VKAVLKLVPWEYDLKKWIVFQMCQKVGKSKKKVTKWKWMSLKDGRKRPEAPVDKSQMNIILLICCVENNWVMEGSPAFS